MPIIPMQSTLLADQLEQTVASVLHTMMGLRTSPALAAWSPQPDHLTATVHYAGAWNGLLMLEVTPIQACLFAGQFLLSDPPAAVDDDVRDVLGELANMIGGNLKCALAPGTVLSMPEVIFGSDFSVRICGRTVVERVAFNCEHGLFWVSLFEKPPINIA